MEEVKSEKPKKMSKKIEAELKQYVEDYGEKKAVYDKEKKVIDGLNSSIKEIMLKYGQDACESGDFTATCTVSESDDMNEERLLHVLKNVLWADKGSMHCPFIKLVEQVDFDALEKAIYQGELTEEQLLEINKCRETKQRVTLRISKKKVKK